MAIRRVVRPELLDSLDPADPQARRSRRDLRLINALMGNVRWTVRQLARQNGLRRIVEIGAGEGRLGRALARAMPVVRLAALDQVPAPPDWPGELWREGDLFATLPETPGDALAGIMIAHHFSSEALGRLGELAEGFRVICLCEPWRAVWPRVLGALMTPLVGKVTRHDLFASIDAGFRPGELPNLLNLRGWRIVESVDWRGSLRMVATRP